ncbi:MAG: TonB-dependent receptor [bacterium]
MFTILPQINLSKKIRINLIVFLGTAVILSTNANAQDSVRVTQTVKGVIRTVDNQQPIFGASVYIPEVKLGAKTNANGEFRIEKVPVGRLTLKVHANGYEQISEDILVTSGKQVNLELEIREKVVKGEDISIIANDAFARINETALSSATTFNVDDVKRFAGSREDPAKMAQNFAGAVGINDQRNDIIIRGGSPLELLWRFDGIDIPNPNHFATQGATGGPVNAINVNLLSNSDFLTGAFPAEYADKNSGVFDLRTRKGNTERFEFVGQMGFAGLEGLIEGPLGGNSSFIVSYRKSTLEIFDALGISLGFAGIPKYDDLTLKANFELSPSDELSFTSLFGTSNIRLEQSKEDSVQTGDDDITNGTDLAVVGSTWKHIFSPQTISQLTMSWVASRFNTEVDSLTTDNFNHVTASTLFYKANSTEASYSGKFRLLHSPNVSNTFSAGIEARFPSYNINEYRTTVRDEADGKPYSLRADGSSFHALSFVNWLYRPSDDWTFNTGVAAQYLDLSKKTSIEPRFSAKWNAAEGQSLNFGFGIHRESQPLVIYFGNPLNHGLDFTQSIHYIVGYENRISNDVLMKLEAYYKDISHAPVESESLNSYSLLNAGANFGGVSNSAALVSNGLGKSYGVEFTMLKHFSNNYYFTTTASLFRQRFTGSDGVWHDGAFDNKFILNLLGGYNWVLSRTFSIEFSAKYTIAGGSAYTPIDTIKSALYNAAGQFGIPYLDEANAFGARNPIYSKLDTKIEFRQNLGSVSIIGFFTAENTLNNKNVLLHTYDPRNHSVKTIYQLGLFPYGGFRVEF